MSLKQFRLASLRDKIESEVEKIETEIEKEEEKEEKVAKIIKRKSK